MGKGSTFTVRLPLPVEAAPVDGVALSREEPARTGPEPGLQILVVDDNVDAAESIAEVLELLGNQVRVAHDGLEALRLARESVRRIWRCSTSGSRSSTGTSSPSACGPSTPRCASWR